MVLGVAAADMTAVVVVVIVVVLLLVEEEDRKGGREEGRACEEGYHSSLERDGAKNRGHWTGFTYANFPKVVLLSFTRVG